MNSVFAWLLTYVIHSTVLLGIAWLVTRRRRLEPAASDLVWKVALLAGLVTGTIQSRRELRTPPAMMLPAAAAFQPVAPVNQPATPALATYKPDVAGVQESAAGATTHSPSTALVVVLFWA